MSTISYRILKAWWQLKGHEEGQTLVEYAFIITVVAVMVIGALVFLKGNLGSSFSNTGSSLAHP